MLSDFAPPTYSPRVIPTRTPGKPPALSRACASGLCPHNCKLCTNVVDHSAGTGDEFILLDDSYGGEGMPLFTFDDASEALIDLLDD